MLTAPQLLALAEGRDLQPGPYRCFFCGAACDGFYPRGDYVAKTFNDWPLVAYRNSDKVCVGCTLAMREHMPMPDKEKPQRMRTYSWLLSPTGAVRMAKGEYAAFSRAIFAPPEPPWSLTIAVSGQKHLLYRTPVNVGGELHTVLLEAERVSYTAPTLQERLLLVKQLVIATGKPALSERMTTGHWLAIDKTHGDAAPALVEQWGRVCDEPLTRLALFLCPGKEKCLEEFERTSAA